MPRLRMTSPSQPGWTRRRSGQGFTYLDHDGQRLSVEDAERVKELVIPPAWQDVWITPYPNGHLQAVGTDAAGRRQYLYHPIWREKRDEAKHDRVLQIARKLPVARETVAEELLLHGMSYERAMATAFRLLDLGYFRIGSDSYATEHGSYGLTTLGKHHVHRIGTTLVFEFVAKSGVHQHIEIVDPDVASAVETMRRRRDTSTENLLAYKTGRTWHHVEAPEVNEFLKTLLGAEVTAKDFRTWHGTTQAAVALAMRPADTDAKRKKAIAAAMRDVADHLGNTPTVARASYVDPRLIDLYEGGETIRPALDRLERQRNVSAGQRTLTIERAVRKLLQP